MKLFDVYPLMPLEPVKGKGCWIWDKSGEKYLDFYGGHAVISIGHSHPHYLKSIKDQAEKLGYYSNSVLNGLQVSLAQKLGRISAYDDYSFFMCNSGAEANENALKLASFHTGKKNVIAFKNAFHGRTSGAVACTDNPGIVSTFNANHPVEFFPFNHCDEIEMRIRQGDVSSVIMEGIQGVGGIIVPEFNFMKELSRICAENQVLLILDEIQSGYGRTGKFFAHQYFDIKPDIITVAKGMGNGFPVGGLLIHHKIKSRHGMLGTTFGGNHLACAASLSVIEILEDENLIQNAGEMGSYLHSKLKQNKKIKEIRGMGLMMGIECNEDNKTIRQRLLTQKRIITGFSGTNTIRLLPPLCVEKQHMDYFMDALDDILLDR